ncbi:cbb3-type cytochrome oxidase assembly protein CcoS [Pseudohaliea rubra]|uniref:Type cbb3 cytochrome oxidase biogenesis protein CcoS, involved in heme b insertion n=1 Tax=Pseudohaliea rubra DSM 19751 TaxID=1265313 RepID=A0A095VPL7_9GAMM|nr:cbb3-type cytochrome oxidase assembly protein CcoS [Pseudohaliea rubra]KGE03330.1 Type cbb3 cytochrome oxidase biogenesis protein CcoS, involved in heme b insertion [Pseudohaliea rubra DSM 19751]
MDSLYLLIPIALVFAAVAVKLLLWAIDNGQYDDLDKEGWRILADEETTRDDGGPAQTEAGGSEQAGKEDRS